MTISGQSSLAKDEIERMIRDAESHAEDDKRRREEAEVRNSADTLVYQTEKLLHDQGDKFNGDEKEKVENGLKNLKEALSGDDIERIKDATDSLVSSSHSFTQRLYEEASASSESTAGPSAQAPSDDEVVDAEIVDEPGS